MDAIRKGTIFTVLTTSCNKSQMHISISCLGIFKYIILLIRKLYIYFPQHAFAKPLIGSMLSCYRVPLNKDVEQKVEQYLVI